MIDSLYALLIALLMPGDLLLVSDTTGMGQAVSQSTGRYTHVAMVDRQADSLFVIDATLKRGVARRPIGRTFARRMPVGVYRLAEAFDTAAVIGRARALVGRPYDARFLPGTEALYCSELVQACYTDSLGRPLFPSAPMNFLAPDGSLPPYWERHFRELGMKVPQGVPGTNPTDLAASPLLKRVW